MNGMVAMQAPDGMWRQVVDEPGRVSRAVRDGDDADGDGARYSPGLARCETYRPVGRSRVACACGAHHRGTAPSSTSAPARDRRRRCGSISIVQRSAASTIAAARWGYLPHLRCTSSTDVTLMRMPAGLLTNSPLTSTVSLRKFGRGVDAQQLDRLRARSRGRERFLVGGRQRITRRHLRIRALGERPLAAGAFLQTTDSLNQRAGAWHSLARSRHHSNRRERALHVGQLGSAGRDTRSAEG